jgi:hypothetical protein
MKPLAAEARQGKKSGLYPGIYSIWLTMESRTMVLVDRPPVLLDSVASGEELTVVIGSNWSPAPADWIDLRAKGATTIVCPQLKPYLPRNHTYPDLAADAVNPDYIYQLRDQGPLSVVLSRQ